MSRAVLKLRHRQTTLVSHIVNSSPIFGGNTGESALFNVALTRIASPLCFQHAASARPAPES